MIQYDRAVIQEFAERLYNKVNSIIRFYTIVGALLGGVGGYFLGKSLGGGMVTSAIVAVVAGLIGFAIGREKAFLLKLQAQTAMCQMKIEQNTSGKIV